MTSGAIGYTSLASGNALFLRALPIPLASDLEFAAREANLEYVPEPLGEVFGIDKRAKALGLESAVAVGLILFVSSWLAKKILDEVYDIKLKPIIRRAIQRADDIVIFGDKKHSLIFLVGIYHQDKETLVLVALKAKDKAELLKDLEMINNVHAAARQMVEKSECLAPLHLYVVENGKVNVEPIHLTNMQEAYERIGT